jgi:prophage DNA circulation protein
MTFRDRKLLGQVVEHSGGRRQVEHEVVAGKGWFEDAGSALRSYTVTAAIGGDDWKDDATLLDAALEMPGPGSFVHPTLGRMSVVVVSYRARVGGGRSRVVEYQIELRESGQPLAVAPATIKTGLLASLSASLKSTLRATFGDTFAVVGQVTSVATAAVQDSRECVRAVQDTLRRMADPTAVGSILESVRQFDSELESLVRTPGELCDRWAALFEGCEPAGQQTVAAMVSAFAAPVAAPVIRPAINRAAQLGLVRSLAAQQAAVALLDDLPDTFEAATAAGDQIGGLLDTVAVETTDPDSWRALRDFRAQVLDLVRTESVGLPHVRQWTPREPSPLLWVLGRLYGDATRLDEVMTRNAIECPLWIQDPLWISPEE